ncbi:hypothetical protein [Rhizobium sp. C4]|uniref:hypothetical protein n=1 Tax=Rhizobium sp. C4 TaxID=1349800 RepID=UPI001E2DAC7D|nr:hypothetical protein [Rhizobium sp. C4]MCD2174445.1 hypothetical protein [Rhizobium sp. C4]
MVVLKTKDQPQKASRASERQESHIERLERIVAEAEEQGGKDVSGMTREEYLARLLRD